MRKRMMLRRKIKKFVNKMGYPSYVKMIGMTESKRLLLRKTLMLDSLYGTDGTDSKVNAFQIVLNPLECPNINKVFTSMTFEGTDKKAKTFNRVFRYDYIRIKSITISIKPAQNVSTNSGNQNGSDLYSNYGDSPISNVYAYFSYKNPLLSPDDNDEIIKSMYGTNPKVDRIKLEGQLKNTYSWPSNKAMTISINKLMYRVNTDPYKICTNTPFDLQYLDSLMKRDETAVYDPFDFKGLVDDGQLNDDNKKNNLENSEEDHDIYGAEYIYDKARSVELPDLQSNIYNLFFGRLVIVSPKQMRFTAEICYDCVLLR